MTPTARSRTISGTHIPDVTPQRRAASWSISGRRCIESTRSLRLRSNTARVFERCAISGRAQRLLRVLAVGRCDGHGAVGARAARSCTSRASTSSRSRDAIRRSSGTRLVSLTSADATSFSDSSWRDQRVADSYRRAFSIATAACAASSRTSSSSSSVKSPPSPSPSGRGCRRRRRGAGPARRGTSSSADGPAGSRPSADRPRCRAAAAASRRG